MSSISAVPGRRHAVTLDLPAFRALLEEQWRHQVDEITRRSMEVLDLREGGVDSDGSSAEDFVVADQLLVAARQRLDETEAALRRIADGSFGVCTQCHRSIPAERLEILPAARDCVSCQQHSSRR